MLLKSRGGSFIEILVALAVLIGTMPVVLNAFAGIYKAFNGLQVIDERRAAADFAQSRIDH